MIETPTTPQFQPLSMSSKKVSANILSEAAVMERPDFIIEKKLVNIQYYETSFCIKFSMVKIDMLSKRVQLRTHEKYRMNHNV